jgi:ankyrin repeat protein
MILGANIEAKEEAGETPLHGAAQENSLAFARLLIDHGADIDAKDDTGGTPLHEAAWKNLADVARLLIDSGANTEGIDLSWMN